MYRIIGKYFQKHFENPNFLYFLISLLLLLILPPFSTLMVFGNLILEFTYGFVILMACIYTSKSYRDLVVLSIIGFISFILFVQYQESHVISIINPIFTLVFYGMVFTRLMQYVFKPKSVALNDLLALCAGYLILGIIASPFFYLIHMHLDNAFSVSGDIAFYDLMYFSFITLTGVGYGDIVPVHQIAKSFAICVGITGQLYLAILVGIIIGKYLSE